MLRRESEEYELLNQYLNKLSDASKKKDVLYAIKMFDYTLNAQSCLRENYYGYHKLTDDVLETKVGLKPIR